MKKFLSGCWTKVLVMLRPCCVQNCSISSPLEFFLPLPDLPRVPSYVVWSLPTLALKSPRMSSLSSLGTLSTTSASFSYKASFSSSGYIIVGVYTLMTER